MFLRRAVATGSMFKQVISNRNWRVELSVWPVATASGSDVLTGGAKQGEANLGMARTHPKRRLVAAAKLIYTGFIPHPGKC